MPLVNLVVSRAVFRAVAWRLFSLRMINLVRGFGRASQPVLLNSVEASDRMADLIAQGFDKLNVGGGARALKGFINIDFVAHPSVEREVVANILDLGFVPTRSMRQIHSNHVVEHLSAAEFARQLQEYRRILTDDGIITIRCPNALGVAYAFWFEPVLEEGWSEFCALGFPPDELFHNPLDVWGHRDLYGFVHWIHGDAGNVENQHQQRITPTALTRTLERAGFKVVKLSEPEALNLVAIARKVPA